jgi:hypothetical protein
MIWATPRTVNLLSSVAPRRPDRPGEEPRYAREIPPSKVRTPGQPYDSCHGSESSVGSLRLALLELNGKYSYASGKPICRPSLAQVRSMDCSPLRIPGELPSDRTGRDAGLFVGVLLRHEPETIAPDSGELSGRARQRRDYDSCRSRQDIPIHPGEADPELRHFSVDRDKEYDLPILKLARFDIEWNGRHLSTAIGGSSVATHRWASGLDPQRVQSLEVGIRPGGVEAE